MPVTGIRSLAGLVVDLMSDGLALSTVVGATMKVWPSAILATSVAARLPLAPGLLSTKTGWPSASDSGCASRRAITSVVPPGAKPTTSRIGLVGHAAWACRAPAAASVQSAAAARRAKRRGNKEEQGRVVFMVVSGLWW